MSFLAVSSLLKLVYLLVCGFWAGVNHTGGAGDGKMEILHETFEEKA